MNTKEIKLQPELEKAVRDLEFSEFTEIQEKAIPLVQKGLDVIGQSHTGSGKTAAFSLPSLEKVTRGQGIQMLVVVPTRELCNQVAREIFKFTKYKPVKITEVYGGVAINPQIDSLRQADVVVSTPGRLLDHLNRGTINLSKVKILVLDEADKMFEMGFVDDVKRIISALPKQRQTLLFSATMSQDVLDIVHHYMKTPEKVKVQSYVHKDQLTQGYYDIDSRDKFSLLVHLLKSENESLAIIFCGSRRTVDNLSNNLVLQGIKAKALHGGLSQNRRKFVMDEFHSHKLDVLIASDIAARGLDIKNVGLVINYDIPKNSKDYVHRIGRTARAGTKGKVISLLCQQDHENFRSVLSDRSLVIPKLETPTFQRLSFVRTSSRHSGSSFGSRPSGGFRGRSSHGGFGGRGPGRERGDRRDSRSSEGGRSYTREGNRSSSSERRDSRSSEGRREYRNDRRER